MKKILFPILIFLFLISSCKDDPVTQNGSFVWPPDSLNILWTNEMSQVLGGDTTDWCMNKFGPAYPNPVSGASHVNIKFSLPVKDTISLYLLKNPGDTVYYINNEPLMSGYYEISINTSTMGSGIKWMYIKMRQNNYFGNWCRNYGDIWIR